jgi:hypothetical protein
VHWLALRCLAAIGDFEVLVRELDNPDRRSLWRDYIALLVDAVGRDPAMASEVRSAMEKLHGAEGTKLYEMLWQYGDKKLTKAAGEELVAYLEHDTLAFRVVTFWNLREIIGVGLYYEPEETAAKRRLSVQSWRKRVADFTGGPGQAEPVLPPAFEPSGRPPGRAGVSDPKSDEGGQSQPPPAPGPPKIDRGPPSGDS